MRKYCAIVEVVDSCATALGGAWARLKWIGRILRNVATGAEVAKSYPDRAIEIVWNRLPPDRAIEVVWNRLPRAVRSWKVTQAIGRLIHRRVCRVQPRGGGVGTNYTRFFRNPPQLELLRDLALEMPRGMPVKIAVLGCSTGAELYSAIWMIRTARPEQEVQALGIDISATCIQAAARGVYRLEAIEVAGISETSHERLFTRHGDTLSVQHWLREGVTWWVGDACSSDLAAHFGVQDIVVANNFLFHMSPERAEACLRNRSSTGRAQRIPLRRWGRPRRAEPHRSGAGPHSGDCQVRRDLHGGGGNARGLAPAVLGSRTDGSETAGLAGALHDRVQGA